MNKNKKPKKRREKRYNKNGIRQEGERPPRDRYFPGQKVRNN
nr:hypothetical protein [Paenibacillus bovis]